MKIFILATVFLSITAINIRAEDTIELSNSTKSTIKDESILNYESDSIEIIFRGIKLKIAKNLKSIGIGENIAIFKFYHQPEIVISTETAQTLNLQLTDLNLNEFFQLALVNKPNLDLEHLSTNDFLNNLANDFKCAFLKDSSTIEVFENEKLHAYQIYESKEPFKNMAWIINKNNNESAVRIESNISEKDFKSLIFYAIESEE